MEQNINSFIKIISLTCTLHVTPKRKFLTVKHAHPSLRNMHFLLQKLTFAGRKIAPNTGANATKFLTLATKS